MRIAVITRTELPLLLFEPQAAEDEGLVITDEGLIAGDYVATEEGIAAERLVATDEGISYTVGAAVVEEEAPGEAGEEELEAGE